MTVSDVASFQATAEVAMKTAVFATIPAVLKQGDGALTMADVTVNIQASSGDASAAAVTCGGTRRLNIQGPELRKLQSGSVDVGYSIEVESSGDASTLQSTLADVTPTVWTAAITSAVTADASVTVTVSDLNLVGDVAIQSAPSDNDRSVNGNTSSARSSAFAVSAIGLSFLNMMIS